MSGQGAVARSEIQADLNKIKARRNKIQAGGDKIQIRRNKIQMPVPSANRGFSIGYRHSSDRAPPRPEAPRSGLEGRSSARGARAGLSSILRAAPSTLLRMRRWLARRQSPPRRRSIRFLKSKPEFALLARKCRFFRREPVCRRGARRQPALCQSWPGPALFDRRKLQRPNSLRRGRSDHFGRGFLRFRWSPRKGGNPAHSGRRESMLGGHSIASAK